MMKHLLSISLFSFLILASACEKNNDLEINGDYSLDLGHTITFNDDEFQIHFDKVTSYFVCPENVICGAPNYFSLTIVIIEKGREETYTVSNVYDFYDLIFATEFGNYKFEIQKLNPFPEIVNPNPNEFSIEFSLKKV